MDSSTHRDVDSRLSYFTIVYGAVLLDIIKRSNVISTHHKPDDLCPKMVEP